jgi:pimeloyl-ACP methyl ester carboxylesterase
VAYVNGRTFVLASSAKGHSIFFFDKKSSNDWTEIQICEDKSRLNGNPEKMGSSYGNLRAVSSVIGVPLSDKFQTTGILFRSNASKTTGLVLYFHGGPAISSDVHSVPRELRRLFEEGYDILAVEYSGSVGGGLSLSENLATKPEFGFSEDANAIYDWVSAQEYAEVHSYSESFGTLPAMYFARKYSSFLKKRIYAAPVLKYPKTDGADKSGRFDKIERGAQFEFEKGVYGVENRRLEFIEFVSANASAYNGSKNDLFIFGQYDKIAPIQAAPKNILSQSSILKVQRDHSFLTADEATIDSIYLHVMN